MQSTGSCVKLIVCRGTLMGRVRAGVSNMDREGLDQLEGLVDKYGLFGVLSGLSWVCEEKSEHIRAHWQDDGLARMWMSHSTKIERLAEIEGGRNGNGNGKYTQAPA